MAELCETVGVIYFSAIFCHSSHKGASEKKKIKP